MRLNRRDFLALLAVTGSTACVGGSDSAQRSLELLGEWPEGEESWQPTICRECAAGCGLLARVVDGRVVGLSGNPLHPVSRGSLCARGHGALQSVYSPDRFEGPLTRRSERLEPADWDGALAYAAEQFRALVADSGKRRVSILLGEIPALREAQWDRFARALPVADVIKVRSRDRSTAHPAERIIYGTERAPAVDWERADLVLSFGFPALHGGPSPVRQHLRRTGLRKRGGRFVQIESRLSPTAARAEDWLAIVPGSGAALALSLARLLVESGRYDHAADDLPGFDSWTDAKGQRRDGFRQMLSREYDLGWCETITGLAPERVERLADEVASAETAVALFEPDRDAGVSALHAGMAVAALNLLLGAAGRRGGLDLVDAPPLGYWPSWRDGSDPTESSAGRRESAAGSPTGLLPDEPEAWAERVSRESDASTGIILIDGVDPVGELSSGAALESALRRASLVVTLASAPDATTKWADVVLPSSHFLESWGEDVGLDEPRSSFYSVARPAIEAVGKTRAAEEIVSSLAAVLGVEGARLPEDSLERAIGVRSRGLHASGRGRIGIEDGASPELQAARARVGAGPIPRSRRQFERRLFDVGVWVETREEYVGLTSGSFGGTACERQLAAAGDLRGRLESLGLEAEEFCLPGFLRTGAELRNGGSTNVEAGLPIVFFESVSHRRRPCSAPWLRETPPVSSPAVWSLWAELNPRTAAPLGLRHMQRVRITTESGSVVAIANLTETARPGILYLPLGVDVGFATTEGRDARSLASRNHDPFGGLGPADGTRATLTPA